MNVEDLYNQAMIARDKQHLNGDEGDYYARKYKECKQQILSLYTSQEKMLERAKTYTGVEGYPCPLCTYENGVFIKHCSLHQQIASQEEKIKELENDINGIIPDKVQPCGCQLCFCEGERCLGCGAKSCSDLNCNVRKGILTYSQHPLIASLQQQVEDLRCCGNCKKAREGFDGLECSRTIYSFVNANYYCDNWKSDNLTKEERK